MALGKKSGCLKSKSVVSAADKELDFGVVRYARGLGRKRVVISCNQEDSSIDLTPKTPSKRRCSVVSTTVDAGWSLLEVLPQEILIRILCGLDHDDLKQLVRVSKTISEATLIAKEWHFAYRTPSKIRAFRTSIELDDNFIDLDEIEAPDAPLTRRFRSPLSRKKLADISVALFAEEEQWPRKKYAIETEM
ncbi:F-box protein SKIP27-like [Cucurbita maxima]|uniref:F-box protein SKIP27-like n=1 Tax=Cucurbita maxima TaxID=3661 RepID=A0A6J1IRQ4_CUCMA|nr:F-box protein SKIP27-like [Cucurbita maxima]